jgi:MFS family permease
MLTGAACFSCVLLAIGLSSAWLLIVPLFVGLGLSSSVFTATNSARLQVITPNQLRGRVMSINTLLFMGSTPIGSLIVGGMAQDAGVQPTVATMGGICVLGVVAALLYQYRVRDRLLAEGQELGVPADAGQPALAPAGEQSR